MPADGLSLELTRLFPAPRARVFEFFAGAALLAEWWGPRGFSIPSIDFVPRVGGTYRIEMQPPEGDAFALTGTFREVDIPSRLAFTFEWEPGDPDDEETVAQLALEVTDDSTSVQLRQGPFKTEARRALHRDGWTESFDKLAELVTEQRR
jgi:uncharacterized protein YndB with AHSA1/START domain